jgi:hypothetical protein
MNRWKNTGLKALAGCTNQRGSGVETPALSQHEIPVIFSAQRVKKQHMDMFTSAIILAIISIPSSQIAGCQVCSSVMGGSEYRVCVTPFG